MLLIVATTQHPLKRNSVTIQLPTSNNKIIILMSLVGRTGYAGPGIQKSLENGQRPGLYYINP